MADIDTDALRAEWDDVDCPPRLSRACDKIHDLCAEIERLRERLAAVEALCDEKTARNLHSLYVSEVRAAARGEGDR